MKRQNRLLLKAAVPMAVLITVLRIGEARPARFEQNGAAPGIAVESSDPLFKEPYIDVDEWRNQPVRHHYVHGGFKGTDTRFSFYFPAKSLYHGRFFQHITPVPDSENLAQKGAPGEENKIGFAFESGGYFVETNGGGANNIGVGDPTITAYRANAAAAEYSRVVAAKLYGPHRPYGYAYGGSGGGYRTIGSIENTTGVWDGVVPYVIGSTMALPNVFTVRIHAMRILWDKFPQINDAVDAGGSGDPYPGLNAEEQAALHEATSMGFPPQSWFGYKTMGVHGFAAIYPIIQAIDPKYFVDFWTLPGYLGANPPASLLRARIRHETTIAGPVSAREAMKDGIVLRQANGDVDTAFLGPGGDIQKTVAFHLSSPPPPTNFLGGDLIIKNGDAAGKSLQIREVSGDMVILGSNDATLVSHVRAGDKVVLDTSNFLAAQTYHRHQVPPGRDFPEWDQFRKPDGTPLYPQRPVLIGPILVQATAGSLETGKIHGKMIVVSSLWDREAFPWQADWYRTRVEQQMGDRFNDSFRLWYTDHALHGDETHQEDPTRTVSYLGILQQALRDLSQWVEKGVPPPPSTSYKVVDGQIVVPPTAAERQGIQAVVSLTANGGARAEVPVGQSVKFSASIELPPDTGKLVAAEWDFDGQGTFPLVEQMSKFKPSGVGSRVTLATTYSFSKPGTYFPALRVTSQRQGDPHTAYGRVHNLGRVRVVVR
jgi:hypothetical protein